MYKLTFVYEIRKCLYQYKIGVSTFALNNN